jgi:uncharacterized membrane protein YeiH
VTAALTGATVFTVATLAGASALVAAVLAFGAAFLVRGGALRFGWAFPAYRSRPGRHPQDIP